MNRALTKALAKQKKSLQPNENAGQQFLPFEIYFFTKTKQKIKLIKQRKRSYFTKQLLKPLLEGNSRAFYQYITTVRSNQDGLTPKLWTNDKVTWP